MVLRPMARAILKRACQYSRGDAGVVELAGDDLEGLAVEGEVVALGAEDVGLRWCLREGWEGG